MAKTVSYKNFWSLNLDEAIVAGILRSNLRKSLEVFMPLNAQMKDIDLVVMNIKNKKATTIQVKGSKAYEPTNKELNDYVEGSGGWFFFPRIKIEKSIADYFIFLIYVFEKKGGRRYINPHTITIPTEELIRITRKNKMTHGNGRYSFYFWINPEKKIAFDHRDTTYPVSRYLDERGFRELNRELS